MASHFEFQNFSSENKLLKAIFVDFSSPSIVATTLGLDFGQISSKVNIAKKKNFFLSFTIEFVFTRISYITYVPLQISCRVPLRTKSYRKNLERKSRVSLNKSYKLYIYILLLKGGEQYKVEHI